MQLQEKHCYSTEEYLASEEASEFRSEYIDGLIFPMSGGSPEHNRLIGNIYKYLDDIADEREEMNVFFADMRLWIPQAQTHTYPDVMVVLGALQMLDNRKDTITNPTLIIEVLSDSTKDYDRGEKFRFYRSIPSFQEYLLVDQYSLHVEHLVKNTQKQWILTDYDDQNANIPLSSIDGNLPVTTIYRKIRFPQRS
jgi:Uma2 family endonuclease